MLLFLLCFCFYFYFLSPLSSSLIFSSLFVCWCLTHWPHKVGTQRTERRLTKKCSHKLMPTYLMHPSVFNSTTTSLKTSELERSRCILIHFLLTLFCKKKKKTKKFNPSKLPHFQQSKTIFWKNNSTNTSSCSSAISNGDNRYPYHTH